MYKEKVIMIIKEIVICLLLIVVVLGLNFLLFKDYMKDEIKVAEVKSYEKIDRSNYEVDQKNVEEYSKTETYETTNTDVQTYQTEYRYEVGTINPFVADGTVNDLPSETVTKAAQ